ncbi:YbbR-like domain-containing protein [Paenibacillus beijingensis]|uniref:YbbR family protein n=1 Tax=Paenibacillus beijingensis TaxID=1126833 RepID=A0A0D5NJ73_9BACL|nr:CdaR family protein [Paenibacillus beijingensis]AJY75316.1 hypothetical protein VN24_12955 [Paenibacillus beijingensis]
MDKWLSHPTALKILSVVIGLLLWGVVHFDPTSTPNTVASTLETKVIEAVKIQPVGLDDKSYSLSLIEPSVVRVMVRGTRSDLLSASDGDYTISVDLNGLTNGEHLLPLNVSLPRGLQLLSLSPTQARVTIDSLDTSTFEAGVVTQGQPAKGYEAGAPTVSTSPLVKVTLPEMEMKQVGSVKVFVNVSGADKPVTERKAKVKVFSNSGDEMTNAVVSPSTLEVNVPVTMPSKVVPLVIGYKGNLPSGISIQSIHTDTKEVTVRGAKELLDKLDKLEADIDLSKIEQSGDVTLELQPPDGLSAVEPNTVTVTVYVVTSATRTINVPVSFDNVPKGLKASVVSGVGDGKVPLQLSGPPGALQSVTAADIAATADLTNLPEGRHSVGLTLSLPPNVTAAGGEAPQVTVDLKAEEEATAPPAEDGTTEPGGGDTGASNDAGSGSGNSPGNGSEDSPGAGSKPGSESPGGQGGTGSSGNGIAAP